MASLSNINGIFDVHSTGAVLFSTSHGAVGQVLKSNGNAAPTWVDVPPIIDDRYVLVAGDTMTGNLSISGTNTLGVGGTISGGSSITGVSIIGTSRVQSDDNMMMVAGQFYIGASTGSVDDTYRFYTASGVYYLQSRKSGTWTSYLEIASDGDSTFAGSVTATHYSSSSTTANIFLGSVITKPGDNLGFIVRNSSNAIIGSLLRTSNTTTELTADTLDLGGTTAQYVRGDGSFATYSPGTGNVTGSGAANRVTYWSSGTNVTSDAGFTYNGAGRVNTDESFGVSKDGADTVADGPFFRLTNAAQDRQYLNQLDASNNIDYWYYNGTAWTQTISLSTDGGATFAGAVNVQGDDKSLIVRNAAGTVIGTMGAESSSTPNVGMTTVRNNGTTTIQFNSNGSSYINGGNLGIGTDSPTQAKLCIDGTQNSIYLTRGGASDTKWTISSDSVSMYIGEAVGGNIMTLREDGHVGIGTTGPSSPLHVDAAPANGVYLSYLYNSATHNSAHGLNVQTSSNNILTYGLRVNTAGDSNALAVMGNGNVGIGTASPTTKLSVTDGAAMYANSNYLVQIKRNAANGNDDTSKASILLANNSNAMQIAYGGTTDRLRFIDGGAVERFTMLNGGNIGIGTSSPDSLLVVQADAHNEAFAGKRSANDFLWFLRNENNSGRFQLFDSSSSQTIEMTGANGRINQAQMIAGTAFALSNGGFATLGSTSSSVPIAIAIDGDASTASIVVPTNKNVCIGGVYNYSGTGVTSLNINASDYPLLAFYAGSTLRTTIIGYSNNTLFTHPLSSAKWQFENGTGMMGELSGAGNLTVKGDVVAYGSPSDISLKENIKPIKNPLGKIKKLKGVTFNWKKSESILDIKEDYGFIAQDVKKVIPELVRKNENELLSMRHQGVIPILVEAIKELEARVKELENK